MSYAFCTELSPACPVELTTYGYLPNFGGNLFFCILFGLCTLFQLFFGIRYRTWTWMIAGVIGCLMETIGYGGRIMMHSNPWGPGFRVQIVCLILAPSLLSATIDLTLKHIVLVFGPQFSPIKPALYTWVFIGLDFFAIIVQAIGGAIAASADNTKFSLLDTGNKMLLAGIILQVVQLVLFGIVSVLYLLRVRQDARINGISKAARQYLSQSSFKAFCIAVTAAYFAVLTRCCYRIPEMSGGWGGPLQRDEVTFLVLDGMMILIAALLLTTFHPGYCFPQLSKSRKDRTSGSVDMEKNGANSA